MAAEIPPVLNGFNQKQPLVFFVNGKKVIDHAPDPEQTLLVYLREKLRLTGTKLGCAEGGCGACTVMISRFDRSTNKVNHLAVNACLTPICGVHGMAVTTVEGIGSTKTRLHPVQERIAKAHGSQCGFCTPGIVMSMYALLRSSPTPTMKDMEIAFQGNLCRCTGYRPIIEGFRTFTQEYQQCPMGEKCCKNQKAVSNGVEVSDKLFEPSEFTPYDASQEPIFPPELKLSSALDDEPLAFVGPRVTWYRPTSVSDLLHIKKHFEHTKIIVGNTEVGVEIKFKNLHYPVMATPSLVPELTSIERVSHGLRVGSAVTLAALDAALREEIKVLAPHETRLYQAIVDMLHWFAGKQIRNAASVGGNIMTGSPISDLNPIFTAAGIELEVQSLDRGVRKVNMGTGFFTGYRRNIIAPDEILVSLFIPKSNRDHYYLAYKQAKRRDDDIAIVNAAFNVLFEDGTDVVRSISVAFGGMAPTTVLVPKTSALLAGKRWDAKLVEEANQQLVNELPLAPSAPGGMIQYRRSLTLSLFFKAYIAIAQELENYVAARPPIPDRERSGADTFHTLVPKSAQLYEIAPATHNGAPVGRPQVHSSAFKQVTGEAIYCDDTPRYENELYLAFVLSTKAHARIVSIDASAALAIPGVHAFFSGKDVLPDRNMVGAVFHDEEFIVTETVTSQGQTLGFIVADTQPLAQRAAKCVKVVYEDLHPIIITIEDAIAKESYYPGYPKTITSGDVEAGFRESDHIVEGELRVGGQEHFYLETNVAFAMPRDSDELELICSSQHPTEIQKLVAHVLGIPASKVSTRVKRMGGGFGGKESRGTLVAIPVAFAAYKLQRPVRCMLDRDEDMMMTGTRHPFFFKYRVGCTKEGRLLVSDVQMYNNAGYSMDLSFSVLERAMFHYDNGFQIPNARISGWVCRTNLPSNTAFRGFGAPQSMLLAEHIIRDVARVTGQDLLQVSRMNLYREGGITHYNQVLDNCNVLKCWDQCLASSDMVARKVQIAEFNKQHRWRKRGISMVTSKFGIAFTALHLNQAGALVHVYTDGSVLLSHSGTEMGQGLHVKMIQVAAQVLNIPVERIHIAETATDKVPNTSPTAASAGSDLNGMAVMYACQELERRLKPYREAEPDKGWEAWVSKAYFDRVSLSATGFYATPGIGYDFATNSGKPFNYFTYGVACSEVEIDCLTGDHQVIRTDIVMDVGSSINPAIDIGQIEGGFMQGYGLFTLEEMIYSPTGQLYSRGPGMYKLPGFADIPAEFNVSLLTGSPNPKAVYSSKAIGEPPLFLAASAFFAIKEAIAEARREENLSPVFQLASPATSARIRMACQDKITEQFQEPMAGTFTPWNVVP